MFHFQSSLRHNERHWIPAYAGMTFEKLLTKKSSSPACDDCRVGGSHATRIPHSLPAQGGAGVSCSLLHARATALACKPVRALQGGIQCLWFT
jgi:hypothetical protein